MISKKTIGKICGGLAVLALGATLTFKIKDNIYWGSINLPSNSKGNYYALGIFPRISAVGTNITGNHYAIGLITGVNKHAPNSVHIGNSTSIGLLGGENYAINSVHNGNSMALGLLIGWNCADNSVHTGDSIAICPVARNYYAANSIHKGNSTALGLYSGENIYDNSGHMGASTVAGVLSIDKEGSHFIGNQIVSQNEQSLENIK